VTASLKQINGAVVLDVPTDPASLFLVRCVVKRLAERLEFPEEEGARMVLAVDEACTNIIRYAYGDGEEGRITLTFVVQPNALEIDVRDFGTPADPETFKPRDLADIRPGGLGIHFIRSVMDRVAYLSPPDGGTLLKLVKFRRPEEESEK
jgi:anti-sigma regulatory factor (Ser/Thr protein kinase)